MDLAPVNEVLSDLVAGSSTALDALGDLEFVRDGIARLASEGSGADRQRACFRRRERPEDVVDLLAIATAPVER
jgi:carboxylate-amine ligase